jgi:hypothetical protein
MSAGIRYVSVPPYLGIPRLSHQFPVEVVVTAIVTGEDVVVEFELVDVGDTGLDVVTEVETIAVVVMGKEVTLDEEQDVKIIDITMRQLSTIQNNPFLIWPPI